MDVDVEQFTASMSPCIWIEERRASPESTTTLNRYVRFNTMQAIGLDVLLIFPDLLERSFNPRQGWGLDLVMSLDSTVFLFLLVSLIYGSSSCLLGLLPRLPIVADAADRQVL
ncbi:PREDICTED: protein TIC 20-v, chloroplastic isoform X2 [Tarenaya hassleriana]|uniref:protein TIC 20-v, chloroplastic isoform X2 n=1 Tax=Tarenaya hassleriana TaxID=28532 RepID=UPI00053C6DEE|nr:PREDICTED: protein TIC 20-v, chloroplastic isoform X2 [Tarenaya hassleriana]XP_010536729.1 PREDICTED: protein TIC 20-v, chloroplastic isoform X2 [Tarenaya hassleriana]